MLKLLKIDHSPCEWGQFIFFSNVHRQETIYTLRPLRVKSRRLFYADPPSFSIIKFLAKDKKPFLLDLGHRAKVNDQSLNGRSISIPYPEALPSFL